MPSRVIGAPEESMGSATSIFVLILVFAVPGSNAVTSSEKMDFKTRQTCEAFRDSVMKEWHGGFDKQRNANKPTAWGICVEKPL
jgi:hypothetical protein